MDLQVDLRACLAGGKDAWDAFVRGSAPVIYAAVQRAVRARVAARSSTHDIDDRVQDVYVRLFREDFRLLRTFDPKRASLATWLSIIARTVVHEHFQKKRVGLATVDVSGIDPPAAEESVAQPEPISPSLLEHLSVQQRRVIQMLFDEGLTVEVAAGRLDVDPQTIRSAKHKALSRLRAIMFQPAPGSARPPPDAEKTDIGNAAAGPKAGTPTEPKPSSSNHSKTAKTSARPLPKHPPKPCSGGDV